MGTRYKDQPAEHWAGPESLDPTPVWKQYLLVALLLALGLAVIVTVAVVAALPQLVAPPALVVGDRLVLAASDIPPVGAARAFGTPLVDDAHAFFLVQPERGRVLALRALWDAGDGGKECRVLSPPQRSQSFAAFDCAIREGVRGRPLFDLAGRSTNGYRDLDQYLVSVSGDRVVVNLSRVIEASSRTSVPVPTGIPRPQTTP